MSCPPNMCEREPHTPAEKPRFTIRELTRFVSSFPEETTVEVFWAAERDTVPIKEIEFYTNNRGQTAVAIVI